MITAFKIFKTKSYDDPRDQRVFVGRTETANVAVRAGRFHTWRKAPMGLDFGDATHAVNTHTGVVYQIRYDRSA